MLEALVLTVGNITSSDNDSTGASGKALTRHLKVGASGIGVALEAIVPRSQLVGGSAGSCVPPFVHVAGVVAHKVPAPDEAGGEGVRQVAVGGEGARGEGQGGAGELWLPLTFFLAFSQVPRKD